MTWSVFRGASLWTDLFSAIGAVLVLFSLLSGSVLWFSAGAVLLVFGIYPQWYLTYLSSRLFFQNETEKIYLSQGEQGRLHLIFANRAKLPVVFATVEFSMDDYVAVEEVRQWYGGVYQFEMALGAGATEAFAVPIKAVSRGLAKMKNLRVKLYDPLRLASLTLSYDFLRKEVVVYPKRKAVAGLEELFLQIEGAHPRQRSIFQDLTAPIGTREYTPSDPFKHIHWKASARTGRLQTKLFEKTSGMTWSIIILLDREITKQGRIDLEEELACAATLCSEAAKRDINVEWFVNTKPMGRSSVVRLDAGSGRAHSIKSLEFLALIQFHHIKTRPAYALAEIDRGFRRPRVIMVIDHTSMAETERFYWKWRRYGHAVYRIHPDGFLQSVWTEGDRLAK